MRQNSWGGMAGVVLAGVIVLGAAGSAATPARDPRVPSASAASDTPRGTTDCNANGIDDAVDIANGASDDCNGNEVPDECEADCNTNGVPDECDLLNGAGDCDGDGMLNVCDIATGAPDCNANGIPDKCDIQNGSNDCNGNDIPDECENDCNANGIGDECELAGGAPDCNGNGVLDDCEVDCNENGVPDDCDIAAGTSFDCNRNNRPDECDISSGLDEDCNLNSIPDQCEIERLIAQSNPLSPIGTGSPQSFVVEDSPIAVGAITLQFRATADLGAAIEYLEVMLNGTFLGRIYEAGASDCPASPDLAMLTIPAETFNAIVMDGDAIVMVTASSAVDPQPALCTSTIEVGMFYQAQSAKDVNANGELDECECLGDLTGESDVNVLDLLDLLALWGTCNTCANCMADFNRDCAVNLHDLLTLLSRWGECTNIPPE